MQTLTKFVLLTILLAVPLENYVYFGYAVYVGLVAIFLFTQLVLPRDVGPVRGIDIIPGLFLVCWTYGLILGLYYQNDQGSIIRNFAGMVCYGLYYVFKYTDMPVQALIRVMLWAGILNITIGFSIGAFGVSGGDISFAKVDILSGQSRAFYSAHVSLAFCILTASVFCSLGALPRWKELLGSSRLLHWVISSDIAFFIASVYYVLLPFGKGFILNYIILIVGAPMLCFATGKVKFNFKYYRRVIVTMAALVIAAMSSESSSGLYALTDNFSVESTGNSIRREQSEALREEFSIFGAGLGASLKNRYERDVRGYGFEQSYENVIHKFGIAFSSVLFLAYAFTLFAALRVFIVEESLASVLALSAGFGFLIPSAGNPMLYATVHVALHCISLYFISGRGQVSHLRSGRIMGRRGFGQAHSRMSSNISSER